ncbi:Y-family DNA polymerase [Aeoliella sp. SH292]|uniref:Y-family DNA polymerase n=1 Tax=Aeoliella sp. SH292 TaxID=3454464 RepID=UPI003F9E9D97
MGKRSTSTKRVIAVWLPHWPIERITSKRPELRGRPLVLESTSARGQRVIACSAEAREAGVEPGMLVAEATALSTLNAVRLPHDALADRRSLEKLASWCHRFSPSVGVEGLDTLVLDATNLAPLYGGEEPLVEQIAQGLARLGLTTRIALADNIATAWGVAHYQLPPPHPNPLPQTIAGEVATLRNATSRNRSGERGQIVPSGENVAALAALPAAALRLDGATLETLARLGIETVGEVLALPRSGLASRFGHELLTRIHQVLGDQDEVIRGAPHTQHLTTQWLLEPPLTKWTHINKVLERLLGQLSHLLSARDAGALEIACQLECQSGPDVTFDTRLFRPTSDAVHLMEIVALKTERLPLTNPVTAVRVHVVRHAPLARQQRVLFERETNWQHSTQLAGLVNRLAGRLGAEAVVRCRVQHEAQAEFAYTEESLVGNLSMRKKPPSPVVTKLAPLDRPLRFYSKPERIETLSFLHEGPPIRFTLAGQQHTVAHYRGPERIETGWWRHQGVRRDYYRVETTEGRRFWLFRCLRRQKWFLHGAYE